MKNKPTKAQEKLISTFVDDLVKRPKGNFSNKDEWLKEWLRTFLANELERATLEHQKQQARLITQALARQREEYYKIIEELRIPTASEGSKAEYLNIKLDQAIETIKNI